ncbi:unnamed protein product [Rhodiola kirilowii]
METRSSKRRKLLLDQAEQEAKRKSWSDFNEENGSDRISDLPDELLHQILLLLPIKTVARTSVLSKRWKSVWRSLPDLDFTSLVPFCYKSRKAKLIIFDRTKSEVAEVKPVIDEIDLIGNVLAHRDRNSMLRSLRFCGSRLSFTRLNDLLRTAVRKNVHELDIEVTTDGHFNLPRCILTSDTLRVFKLKSGYPGFRLPPKSVLTNGFRSLQLLSLSFIVFSKHFSLNDFFTDTSFPLLKHLSLEYCLGLEHVRFSCRVLEELVLQRCYELRSLEITCAKLVKLVVRNCLDDDFDRVYVNGPQLRRIEWEWNAIGGTVVCFQNFDALRQASMVIDGMTASNCLSVSKLLTGISHVTCLSLDCKYIEMLSRSATPIKPFHNLTSLELHTGFRRMSFEGLSYILSKSPFVQNLTLMINAFYCGEKAEVREFWDMWEQAQNQYWDDQAQVLKSFLQHLKVVKICGFFLRESEVSFVTFFIKHAPNLEKIFLITGYYSQRDFQLREKIRTHLSALCAHYVSATPPQIIIE